MSLDPKTAFYDPKTFLVARRPFAAAVMFCLAVFAGACSKPQVATQHYRLKGKVLSIDKSQNQVLVDHEAIPGFMDAMAMPYTVKDPALLNSLAPNDQITADLVVSAGRAWLENIVVMGKGAQAGTRSESHFYPPETGAEAPNFTLLNQDGKKVQLNSYKGRAVLLTFIYTRCPLPDYCPLMDRNFAEIDRELAKSPGEYSKTHLLSVSFDPEHDTPQTLETYGQKYLHLAGENNFKHWEFVAVQPEEAQKVGAFFGLLFKEEQGIFTHSLSTVILDPQGKIYKWYPSNHWQPADILKDLNSLLGGDGAKSASLR